MPFDPLPTSLPDLSRSRPKSFRRGTAIDHIVSFPSPPPIGGASTERRDPASLFASSTSQRPASVSGHGGLRVWQAARSGSCLHYHTNGRSIQDLRSYLPTRDQVHAHTHTRARVSLAAYTRSRTPSRLSTCTLDHALRRSPRFQRSNPSLVYSSSVPTSFLFLARDGTNGGKNVPRIGMEETPKGSCSMLEISAGGSETVGNWKEGKGWMETLDRSFVKGENDSEGNSRSGYAISFI